MSGSGSTTVDRSSDDSDDISTISGGGGSLSASRHGTPKTRLCAYSNCSNPTPKLMCPRCSRDLYCSEACSEADAAVHATFCVDALPVVTAPFNRVGSIMAKLYNDIRALESKDVSSALLRRWKHTCTFAERQFHGRKTWQSDWFLFQVMDIGAIWFDEWTRTDVRYAHDALKYRDRATRIMEAATPTTDTEKSERHEWLAASYTHYSRLVMQYPKNYALAYECAAVGVDHARQLRAANLRTVTAVRAALCPALRMIVKVLFKLKRYKDGAELSKEAYAELTAEHGAIHPDVQATVQDLIDCCVLSRQLEEAEQFARADYLVIIDPNNGFDLEGPLLGCRAGQYAEVTYQIVQAQALALSASQHPPTPAAVDEELSTLDFAEKLAMLSLSIFAKKDGDDSRTASLARSRLARIVYRKWVLMADQAAANPEDTALRSNVIGVEDQIYILYTTNVQNNGENLNFDTTTSFAEFCVVAAAENTAERRVFFYNKAEELVRRAAKDARVARHKEEVRRLGAVITRLPPGKNNPESLGLEANLFLDAEKSMQDRS